MIMRIAKSRKKKLNCRGTPGRCETTEIFRIESMHEKTIY